MKPIPMLILFSVIALSWSVTALGRPVRLQEEINERALFQKIKSGVTACCKAPATTHSTSSSSHGPPIPSPATTVHTSMHDSQPPTPSSSSEGPSGQSFKGSPESSGFSTSGSTQWGVHHNSPYDKPGSTRFRYDHHSDFVLPKSPPKTSHTVPGKGKEHVAGSSSSPPRKSNSSSSPGPSGTKPH
ncbi:unnamed protein product [Sympodiomycopsis kandeliae]